MNEQEFREKLREKGYGEPKIRDWEPNLDKEMHTHDLSAMALVTQCDGPGESCELLAGTLHTEITGPNGAVTLLAYK